MANIGPPARRLRQVFPGRRRGRRQGLMSIHAAIASMLTLALAVTAGTFAAAWHYLHFLPFQREPLSAETLYDLLKVAFAFAAGVGGVVALVIAYRRQRVAELAHDLAGAAEERETCRVFNERFAAAATQLGDANPAVRVAGVYAMAGLADDWQQRRQTCVDVLCAHLRMPYEPEPADGGPSPGRQAFAAAREVRQTIIRVITAHIQPADRRHTSLQDWRGLNLDFTGAIFDGGDFSGGQFTGWVSFGAAQFVSGVVDFSCAEFIDARVSFRGADFTGATVSFEAGQFTGSKVDFTNATFTAGTVDFGRAEFSPGRVDFAEANFTGGSVGFGLAKFTGGVVNFLCAEFAGSEVDFRDAQFTGKMFDDGAGTKPIGPMGDVDFLGAHFISGEVDFGNAEFGGATVSFIDADFTGAMVSFEAGQFTGSKVDFTNATFTGGTVDFTSANFAGGLADFSKVKTWRAPPLFPLWDKVPAALVLPASDRDPV